MDSCAASQLAGSLVPIAMISLLAFCFQSVIFPILHYASVWLGLMALPTISLLTKLIFLGNFLKIKHLLVAVFCLDFCGMGEEGDSYSEDYLFWFE